MLVDRRFIRCDHDKSLFPLIGIKGTGSAGYSDITMRPYVVMDFDPNVEIGTDTTYLKLGDVLSLSVASNPNLYPITWSVDNASAAMIMTGTSFLTASSQTPGKVTVTANITVNGAITPVDTMTVYVVPVLPGEYYIETPMSLAAGQCFIEPRGTETSNQLTVNTLDFGNPDENIPAEDNRIAVTFVPEGNYGYYTLKHVVRARYLGLTGSQIALNATQVFSSQKFDIQQCTSGNYKIVTLVNSHGYVVSAASDPTTAAGAILTNKAYTQDQSYNDEWIFHRIMPTNGYEREYNPGDWQSNYHNCLSYAIDAFVSDASISIPTDLKIIGPNGNDDNTLEDVEDARHHLLVVAEDHGFYVQEIEKYQECPNYYYKIAFFLALEGDSVEGFHFYRQNRNGTWSHKQGTLGTVTKNDVSGSIIFDPENSDRDFPSPMKNYNLFVGYYAVNPVHYHS